MNYCLIPARSGSKRIKNKNIKDFFGKPVIAYTIETAIKSKLFDRIFVSTDSKKIARISEKYGAEVPFLRPKKLSNDFAKDKDVINHFLNYIKGKQITLTTLCYIYPINPLLRISTLKKCKNLLLKSNCKRVMTIGRFSYPIERALKLDDQGFISFKSKKFKNKRSQDLKPYFHDAAQCYWLNFKKNNNNKTKAVILKQFEFLDVDEIDDYNNLKKIYFSKLYK